ncbi:MAG: ATP-binding protein [Thermodesulfobacteriota bacterium]
MISEFPVAVLSGARQVGKSTMLWHEFADFAYLTLDDLSVREQARLDPASLWQPHDRLIIDEAQKLPQLFEAIKLAVDRPGGGRRFILSGSANLLLMERVSESLAGRAGYCELLPMTCGEELSHLQPGNLAGLWQEVLDPVQPSGPAVPPLSFLLRGFMPPVLARTPGPALLRWLESYVMTYLERHLRQLSQVESLVDFRKVMGMLALRTGSILNQADVAKDSGTSHATTHRYIRLLEVSGLIARVPAFIVNRGKRLVKSPKIFFLDPGLAVFLAGYFDAEALGRARELGGFFETLVHLHLRAWCDGLPPRAQLFYWRTVSGREVDFVVQHGRQMLAFEVKLTPTPTVADAASLLLFLEQYPEAVRGILVHAGDEVRWLHSKILAVPWWWLDL